MCRTIDSLKWIARWGWLLLVLSGCATDFRSPLLPQLSLSPSFLKTEQRVPVVYPYEEERQEGAGDSMVDAYGPAWRDLHGRYPEYHFN